MQGVIPSHVVTCSPRRHAERERDLPGLLRGPGSRGALPPVLQQDQAQSVVSTNITPDSEQRHRTLELQRVPARDARGHLARRPASVPGVPLHRFAQTSDDDLQALYAYLMSLPAVRAPTRAERLRFPFGLRPLMAGWNALSTIPRRCSRPPRAPMEPRRLPRERARPLRRLPHAAQCARRGAGRQRLPRRAMSKAGRRRRSPRCPSRPCHGTKTSSTAICARPRPAPRHRGRADGAGGARPGRGAGRRCARDGELPRVVSSGRATDRPAHARSPRPPARPRRWGPAQRMFDERLRRLPPRRRRLRRCSASTCRSRSTATCTARGPTTCCAPSSTACASRLARDRLHAGLPRRARRSPDRRARGLHARALRAGPAALGRPRRSGGACTRSALTAG